MTKKTEEIRIEVRNEHYKECNIPFCSKCAEDLIQKTAEAIFDDFANLYFFDDDEELMSLRKKYLGDNYD